VEVGGGWVECGGVLFFFNGGAATGISTLSLHGALPFCVCFVYVCCRYGVYVCCKYGV